MAARGRAYRARNPEKKRDEWRLIPKERRAAQNARWRQNNLEKVRAKRRALYAANRENELANARVYKARHKDRLKAARQILLQEKPEINRAARSLRRAVEKQARPLWYDAKAVLAIFERARLMSESDGIQYHVDHVVPLQSKLVCGLHWHGNLQILTSHENHVKKNVHWPDMPAQLRA